MTTEPMRVNVGDLITWNAGYATDVSGVVVSMSTEDRTGVDGSLVTADGVRYGRLCQVECDDPACTSCRGGMANRPDWKHSINECQILINLPSLDLTALAAEQP